MPPANAWGRLGREALTYVLSVSLILGPTLTQAQAASPGPAPGVNTITTDGRTATRQAVSGSVTNIRTGTVSGGNAFNSFSVFQEGAGNTVNLHVPQGAGNLVNIVRDAPVVVNGVLNSYKSGQIGGNVFFADPHGFIVGASGTVNVGSLTVTTPTRESLEGVIRPNGTVDNGAAQSLMRGDLPLSPDGIIAIHGHINAATGVKLSGQEVHVGSGAIASGARLGHQQKFDATVNTQGRVDGAAISVANGAIEIVAAGDASVAGRLNADSTAGKAGRIAVTAGHDVTIARSARLSASARGAAGDAGSIVVKAGHDLVAHDGAKLAASAAGSGNAGGIELSAAGTETIGLITTDLSSRGGRAGSLLYDPTNLIIGSASSPLPGSSSPAAYQPDYSVAGSIFSGGADVTLLASNSITIAGSGVIDTRNISAGVSVGNSGAISITAPTISLQSGAQLLAGAINAGGSTWKAGDVGLFATQTAGGTASIAAASGSWISGGNLTLTATSSLTQTGLLIANPQAHATIELQSATLNATGEIRLTAGATANGTASLLTPVATLTSDVLAAVDVLGSSRLGSTGGGITLAATATTDMEASLASPDLAALLSGTALAAVVKATNTARASVGGTSALSATGGLGITATGNTTVKAIADGSAVSGVVGGTVAVGLIDATTTAAIGGQATVAGNALTLAAHSRSTLVATAKATAGGASTPDAGSASANTLSDPKYGQYETVDGKQIGVAAAIAVADLTNNASATMNSSMASVIGGRAGITSDTANTSTATADGSGVASGSVGVGAAVALGLTHVANDATLAQNLTSAGLDVTALMAPGGTNSFAASATSGAGGSDVGVAGSVAISLADIESAASLAPAAIVAAGGGSVLVGSSDASSVTTEALPVAGSVATGGKVGVGASVALSIVANRSTALIDTGASVTGAGSLSVTASGAYDVTTTASAGSAGGVSITPSVAVAVVTNRTAAQIDAAASGAPALSTSSGDLVIGASSLATETTSASGTAAGGSVAVGAAIAVAVVSDDVTATTLRDLSSGGALTVSAAGSSRGSVSSTAGASGGNAADSSGAAPAGESANVDDKVTGELSQASTDQAASGVGDSSQQASSSSAGSASKRSASSSEGKVSVAAGIAVSVAEATVTATIPDGVNAQAAGRLSVTTDANTDSLVTADASAVGSSSAVSKVGIGAAVAVNVAHQKNDATLGNGTHSANGVTVTALQDDLVTPPAVAGTARQDKFGASATSGAGGSSVGVAGSLGLDLIDTESVATIAANSQVSAGGGSVLVGSSDASSVTTEALPVAGSVATGGKVGVGASVALSIVANRSTALIDTGASLTGAGSLSVTASGAYDVTTTASAGSAGGVSITPSVAVAVVTNRTAAQIDAAASGSPGAEHVVGGPADRRVVAGDGNDIGLGHGGGRLGRGWRGDRGCGGVGRRDGDDAAGPVLGRCADGLGGGFLARLGEFDGGGSGGNAADSSGAAPAGESANVDDKVTGELSQASTDQAASGVGDSSQQASSSSAGSASKRSASSSEGKVSVAAGIAVAVAEATVTATIPDGVNAQAAGRLSVTTDANTDSLVTADASAVGSSSAVSKVGIGAAVAVNVAHQKNDATLGNGTHSANGVTVTALQDDLVTPPAVAGTARQDRFGASATSGAGGSSVGVAGSLGLDLIDTESVATIAANSQVSAGGGSVLVGSSDASSVTTEALPVAGSVATGGKVGVGASVALSIVANRSTALIDTGASLSGAGSLSVTASGAYDVTTTASAGSAGGVSITPSVAVAVVTNRTAAQINAAASGSHRR